MFNKFFMKKIFLINLIICCSIIFSGCEAEKPVGMPNPWCDCGTNANEARNIAGFNFGLAPKGYEIRAMKNVFEVHFPLDKNRIVTVRKTMDETNDGDCSGDYNQYPMNKEYTLPNTVVVNIRGNKELVNVMYFCAESGCFSVQCNEGMSYDEIYQIFKMIEEVEAPKF